MAVTFTLASTGLDTMDFAEAALDDVALQSNIGLGWLPKVAVPRGDGSIPDYITEVIPIWIECSSHNNFALTMQRFHALQKRASEYWVDPQQAVPVWLNVKTDDETGARRVLLKSLGLDFGQEFGGLYNDCPDLDAGRPANMVIVRHPYWERDTSRQFPESATVAGCVTSYDYTAAGGGGTPAAHDIVGDGGARIADFQVEPMNADSVARFWMGIRSGGTEGRHGTLANFVPTWEAEVGELGTDVAIDAVNDVNGASPGLGSGSFVQVTESALDWDDTWHAVVEIELADVSANEVDNYGLFLWLVRAQVSAGTWDIQLRFTTQSDFTYQRWVNGNIIEISSATWELHEADVYPIPHRDLHAFTTAILADSFDQDYEVAIYARRTSGVGTLDIDCLVLIPVDEGFLRMSNNFDDPSDFYIATSPEDQTSALIVGGTVLYGFLGCESHNFTLPPGDGRMIIAWADADDSDFTDTIEVNSADYGGYYERWLTLRGAE